MTKESTEVLGNVGIKIRGVYAIYWIQVVRSRMALIFRLSRGKSYEISREGSNCSEYSSNYCQCHLHVTFITSHLRCACEKLCESISRMDYLKVSQYRVPIFSHLNEIPIRGLRDGPSSKFCDTLAFYYLKSYYK